MGSTEVSLIIEKLGKFLDKDTALEAANRLRGVYEQSVRVTARLLPELVGKTDGCLAGGDLRGFAINVHGMKGVLCNIGVTRLGYTAARLEKAAAAGEAGVCKRDYPPFREQLMAFAEQARAAVAEKPRRGKMNRETLCAALRDAKSAAGDYDAVRALESVSGLSGFSYNKEADALLEKVVFALQEFNCKGAITNIEQMEGLLNGGT